MENDFRNPDKYPQDRNVSPQRYDSPNVGIWLVVGMVAAVALVAVFAFRGDGIEMPTNGPITTAETNMVPPNEIEPAEGDAFKSDTMTATPAPVAAPTTVVPSDTPDATAPVVTTSPVSPTESIHTYASEEECAAATDKPCHYVTCDSIPEGKQPDEVCGPSFQKGWQSIVPVPDKTAVPEAVAPPLTGQGTAPVEKPPLTGQ